jgi:hypothetical protein
MGFRRNPSFMPEGERPRAWEPTGRRFLTVSDAKYYASENARQMNRELQYRICIGHRTIMVSVLDSALGRLRWEAMSTV